MSRKKTQQVLVPKGTIDPDEDTVIEIPKALQGQSMVIAKNPENDRNVSRLNRSRSNKSVNASYFPNESVNVGNNTTIDAECCTESSRSRLDFSRSRSYNRSLVENRSTQTLQSSVIEDLKKTEENELYLLESRLREFQNARRQFLLETTGLAKGNHQGPDQTFMSRSMPVPSMPSTSDNCFKNRSLPYNLAAPHFGSPAYPTGFGSVPSSDQPGGQLSSIPSCCSGGSATEYAIRRPVIDPVPQQLYRSSYGSGGLRADAQSQTNKSPRLSRTSSPRSSLDQQNKTLSLPIAMAAPEATPNTCSSNLNNSYRPESRTPTREPLQSCLKNDYRTQDTFQVLKPPCYQMQQTDSNISKEDIDRLKRQFDESRRKLEEAITIASQSVYNRTKYCPPERIEPPQVPSYSQFMYDSQPERDRTLLSSSSSSKCCSKPKCKKGKSEDDYDSFRNAVGHSSSFIDDDLQNTSKTSISNAKNLILKAADLREAFDLIVRYTLKPEETPSETSTRNRGPKVTPSETSRNRGRKVTPSETSKTREPKVTPSETSRNSAPEITPSETSRNCACSKSITYVKKPPSNLINEESQIDLDEG